MSEKTEEPTPRRLRSAQEEGDSGISAQLGAAVSFIALLALLPAAALHVAGSADSDLRERIESAALATPLVAFDPSDLGAKVLMGAAPLLACAAAVSALASFVQSGGVVATKKLTPKLARLDVLLGFARLFSLPRFFAVARAMTLSALVVYFVWQSFRDHATDLVNLAGRTTWVSWVALILTSSLMKKVAAVGLGLAFADLWITRASWKKKLKMTRDEVKRERKETDGDPEQRAARERAHLEMLTSAGLGNVRAAAVVVTSPRLACALRYDEAGGDVAPVVVASGEGDAAARIMKAARDYGVPALHDETVARALAELEVGDRIPETLYESVAAILRDAWDAPA